MVDVEINSTDIVDTRCTRQERWYFQKHGVEGVAELIPHGWLEEWWILKVWPVWARPDIIDREALRESDQRVAATTNV